MSAVWIMKAAMTALWTAGSGLIALAWLSAFSVWWKERSRRRVMLGPAEGVKMQPFRELAVVRKIAEEMEIAGIRWPVEAMLAAMLFAGTGGWFAVDAAVAEMQRVYALDADRLAGVDTWLLNTASALLLGSLPYFYVLFRLQSKRHRIAHDMIKLVQNVISHYAEQRTVQELISRSAATMPEHVRDEWKRLELRAHLGAPLEEALYEFARRADNGWAEDVADILLIKHRYGNDVLEALHKLVVDMQRARKNEERRLATIAAYRIGTVIMIAFAFGIVFFNVYADGANYRHYFISPTGQNLLIVSAVVLFASLVMVVRSGRRTF